MAQLDLPLEKLHKYAGRNPKPAAFEAFWDDSLAEMHALDPQIELKRHEIDAPFAQCFDLTFTGTGGARVYAKYLRPTQTAGPAPAILNFHGYSGASDSNWSSYLAYVARGFCVAALDCRGQGGRSNDSGGASGTTLNGHIIRGLDDAVNGAPQNLYYRHVFLDTALLARIVGGFEEVDANRLGAQGGSQGGALTLACAALSPIKRAAATYPFLCDYQRVWEMDASPSAYAELKTYFRHFDPRHERETEIFTALGHIDIQHLMPRVTGEVLMATSLMDAVCPSSAQFAAYNKIQSPKEVVIYPDFAHESLPGMGDRVWEWMSEL